MSSDSFVKFKDWADKCKKLNLQVAKTAKKNYAAYDKNSTKKVMKGGWISNKSFGWIRT